MEEVRLGVIGCGGMGRNHMRQFAEIPRLKFTAASDSFAANLKLVTEDRQLEALGVCKAMHRIKLLKAIKEEL